jgi:hypothetical protein
VSLSTGEGNTGLVRVRSFIGRGVRMKWQARSSSEEHAPLAYIGHWQALEVLPGRKFGRSGELAWQVRSQRLHIREGHCVPLDEAQRKQFADTSSLRFALQSPFSISLRDSLATSVVKSTLSSSRKLLALQRNITSSPPAFDIFIYPSFTLDSSHLCTLITAACGSETFRPLYSKILLILR